MILTHLVLFSFFDGASESGAATSVRKQSATLIPPLYWNEPEKHRYLIAQAVQQILNGKLNGVGEFTLTASSATTVVKDRRVGVNSMIIESPTTQNAGGEVGIYYTAIGTETDGVPSFTVNHGTDSRSDRTFRYIILG